MWCKLNLTVASYEDTKKTRALRPIMALNNYALDLKLIAYAVDVVLF
jgi:hypothetical protein